jgi:hypothetical protein
MHQKLGVFLTSPSLRECWSLVVSLILHLLIVVFFTLTYIFPIWQAQKYCLWSARNPALPGNPKREGRNEDKRVQCLHWSNSRLYNVPSSIGSTGKRRRGKTFGRGRCLVWFITCAAELALQHYDCALQIKTNSSLFPKGYIEAPLENAPGGCKIVLSGSHKGIPLIAISYRYSTRTTLLFVVTKNAGSTWPGKPYEMKFNDAFGNVVQRLVECPEILSDFFQKSNTIDKHNQLRQGHLTLEKHWLTQDPYFHLHTTITGM